MYFDMHAGLLSCKNLDNTNILDLKVTVYTNSSGLSITPETISSLNYALGVSAHQVRKP